MMCRENLKRRSAVGVALFTMWSASACAPIEAPAPPASFTEYLIDEALALAPNSGDAKVVELKISSNNRHACGVLQVSETEAIPFTSLSKAAYPLGEHKVAAPVMYGKTPNTDARLVRLSNLWIESCDKLGLTLTKVNTRRDPPPQ